MAADSNTPAGGGKIRALPDGHRPGAADVNLPRTAVPIGIADPVASARAELKAALHAIEVKGNVPRRLEKASAEGAVKARAFVRNNPVGAVGIAVGVAAVVGGLVWAIARSIAR